MNTYKKCESVFGAIQPESVCGTKANPSVLTILRLWMIMGTTFCVIVVHILQILILDHLRHTRKVVSLT